MIKKKPCESLPSLQFVTINVINPPDSVSANKRLNNKAISKIYVSTSQPKTATRCGNPREKVRILAPTTGIPPKFTIPALTPRAPVKRRNFFL